jgi:hypothetical protein
VTVGLNSLKATKIQAEASRKKNAIYKEKRQSIKNGGHLYLREIHILVNVADSMAEIYKHTI